ncbi:LuxR C-terminal-related transcriptional regulator [Actinoplanes sp. NPDC048988]|uniref:helix-turn-helix transcriptional regulator n=1 Tax=Actinoplanes sp. NPDC048988 TaxID=3363901 RepID=UPI0037236453
MPRGGHRWILAELARLGRRPLSASEVYERSDALLRPALGYDGVCWHDSDPATGLVTSVHTRDLRMADFRAAVELEVWGDGIATFPAIRVGGRTAESLSNATRGRPARSRRWRELIQPAGYGDELRAVFDHRGGLWGCAAFMRAPDRGHYRPGELALASAAAPLIGAALRLAAAAETPARDPEAAAHPARGSGAAAVLARGSGAAAALARTAGAATADSAPAVLVIGPDNRLVQADERGRALAGELAAETGAVFGVPLPFVMAAEHARAAAGGMPVPALPLRARSADGTWHVLHASVLGAADDGPPGAADGRAGRGEAGLADGERGGERTGRANGGAGSSGRAAVAVVAAPAGVGDLMPVVFAAFGLTGREAQVATLAVRGLSTAGIAEALAVSPWTVQDHLKAVFDKAGVRSRREFAALLMAGATGARHR